jgi:hypothetical protein
MSTQKQIRVQRRPRPPAEPVREEYHDPQVRAAKAAARRKRGE